MIGSKFQPKVAYRMLRVIFYSLNTGLLIFFMASIYVNDMQIPEFSLEIDILTVVNILLLGAIPIGYLLSNRKMEAIDAGETFQEKFTSFSTSTYPISALLMIPGPNSSNCNVAKFQIPMFSPFYFIRY